MAQRDGWRKHPVDFLGRRRDLMRLVTSKFARDAARRAFASKIGCQMLTLVPWARLITFPAVVVADTTNDCNLRCRMCWRKDIPESELRYMGEEMFFKIVDEIAQHPGTAFVPCGLGEPLMHPQLVEWIPIAKKKGVSHIVILTNGLLVDQKVADTFIDCGLDELRFSLEGNDAKTYESIRVGGSFEQVVENVTYVVKARNARNRKKPRVVIATIDMPKTRPQLPDFYKRWDAILSDHDSVLTRPLMIHPSQRSSQHEKKEIKWRWLTPCRIPWRGADVSFDGKLGLACCADPDKTLYRFLGEPHLDRMSIKEFWTSPQLARLRRLQLSKGRMSLPTCAKCVEWTKLVDPKITSSGL
jgi:MoaA/NifB/PqqE/SkfB family radical SAM enzyme